MTTNVRIWNALHPSAEDGCVGIINSILSYDATIEEDCRHCLLHRMGSFNLTKTINTTNTHGLNDSQMAAVSNCIALSECDHRNSLKLIWGPPGTGKTKTIASLVFRLLKLRCRTLVCAPTNVAVVGVAARFMQYLSGQLEHEKYGLGDVVLFGNGKRMKIDEHEELCNVFLDHRASVLAKCFAPLTGWRAFLNQMIHLLEDPEEQYKLYTRQKQMETKDDSDSDHSCSDSDSDHSCSEENLWSFAEFIAKMFVDNSTKLIDCIERLCAHLPTNCLPVEILKVMIGLQDKLETVLTSVSTGKTMSDLSGYRVKCLSDMKFLQDNFSIPTFTERHEVLNFCLENALLVFCTVSSSAKLHTEGMKEPLKMVIIDEAAQLKECESCIPLQLPGLCHAILVGDEKQIPAMVMSKICEKAGFGRSLFERLVKLGHSKHLLRVQYRMHPSISFFSNREFYGKQIIDGDNVVHKSYEQSFLKGRLFGSYSFIHITNGKEEFDNSHSLKNIVEVHVVAAILSKLYKECIKSNKKVRVGCISPYKAQVFAIQKMVEKTYATDASHAFSVNVRSVDGFQGGEEDVIIISTVRSNGNGSIGFLTNRQRTNVSLTRAKYCLWVLGNEATLRNSGSVWQKLIVDAKNRGCFNNACDDKDLSLAIGDALIEIGQLQSLFTTESVLFKASKWTVSIGAKFRNSIEKIKDVGTCKQVATLLVKLSNGWREQRYEATATFVESCDVDGQYKLIWVVDILCEDTTEKQILRILDIVTHEDDGISGQEKFVEDMTMGYTFDQLNRCRYKHMEGELRLPMTWSDASIIGTCLNNNVGSLLAEQIAALSFFEV